jgi:hypothetical protein
MPGRAPGPTTGRGLSNTIAIINAPVANATRAMGARRTACRPAFICEDPSVTVQFPKDQSMDRADPIAFSIGSRDRRRQLNIRIQPIGSFNPQARTAVEMTLVTAR